MIGAGYVLGTGYWFKGICSILSVSVREVI
jgi:hypothetical protein